METELVRVRKRGGGVGEAKFDSKFLLVYPYLFLSLLPSLAHRTHLWNSYLQSGEILFRRSPRFAFSFSRNFNPFLSFFFFFFSFVAIREKSAKKILTRSGESFVQRFTCTRWYKSVPACAHDHTAGVSAVWWWAGWKEDWSSVRSWIPQSRTLLKIWPESSK